MKDALELARGYAARRHGDIGAGDPVRNAESFVWRQGFDYPNDDLTDLIASLTNSVAELSDLTRLPPSSFQRMIRLLREGQRAGRTAAGRDGRR